MLYLYKNFIVLDSIYLLFLILSRIKLNLFVINLRGRVDGPFETISSILI